MALSALEEHRPERRRAADRRLARQARRSIAPTRPRGVLAARPRPSRRAGASWPGAWSRAPTPARRPGQALHPPGPRLGPRRARPGRRAVEGRQAGGRPEGADTRRDGPAPGRRGPRRATRRGASRSSAARTSPARSATRSPGPAARSGPAWRASAPAPSPITWSTRSSSPSKQVKEGYHAIAVATDDGRVYTGIKLRQTDTRAGPPRRRGPRGLDPGLRRSTSRRWPARSCRRGWPTS